MVRFMIQPLYRRGKRYRYPLNRGLGRAKKWSASYEEEKNTYP
jgi:hypothetical protein